MSPEQVRNYREFILVKVVYTLNYLLTLKELDQIELPYSFLKQNYSFSYRLVLDRSINKEVFDFKIGLCDFLLKKITIRFQLPLFLASLIY